MRKRVQHPLSKLYEEMNRCLNRTESYRANFTSPGTDEEDRMKKIRDHLNKAISMIPEDFQKTRYDILKHEN